MFLTVVLLLIQCLSSAALQFCSLKSAFPVNNCVACSTLDTSRDGITMAVCKRRNTSLFCECAKFPNDTVRPTWQYYLHAEENVNTCTNDWAEAPGLFVFFRLLGAGLSLYAVLHVSYSIYVSEICTCQRKKCTKFSISTLLFFLYQSSSVLYILFSIVGYAVPFGGQYGYLLNTLSYLRMVFLFAFGPFITTAVFSMAFSEDNMSRWRLLVGVVYWTLSIVAILSLFLPMINGQSLDPGSNTATKMMTPVVAIVTPFIMIVAHRKMRQIVTQYSTSGAKPALVIKVGELCEAICRYYYPIQAPLFLAYAISSVSDCVRNSSPATAIVIDGIFHVLMGITQLLYAFFLEAKGTPTFPCCFWQHKELAHHRSSQGLQMTTQLGNALMLLAKHGLDKGRKKDFPVEVAMETLLSSTPLLVAATDNIGLMSAIQYFEDRCVNENGKIASRFLNMPIGRMLRGGTTQHTLKAYSLRELRETAQNCVKWANDPDREPIYDTTHDEAAAIMLYTQETCLYPMLNNQLREHSSSEEKQAFLPYLKLLLKGLNKLPLVRKTVYRGIKADVHDVYNQLQNKVFTWWAFSSTTVLPKLAEAFLDGRQSTLFTIDAIGVDVAPFSSYPDEQELLLLPGTYLMVEPGVVADAGHWTYEGSVWRAAQQRRREYHHQQSDGHSAKGVIVDNDSKSDPKGADEKDKCVSVFQNTDFPHPGWEAFVLDDDTRPVRTECVSVSW